ncbi:ABC-2 type transport system ATP-binding protein [Paenibacillus sophorae]|uniref:ABC transporter ATP-binding protein n=1 Tax=Paenibacillus sophorae TaxID=1333845 RepID=A0A1H8FJE3_9BACL|nr:ABC transporter ATP-binding protein [Paenibacillus sophorae]QWU13895.1 ABC transporter ATP-binding protein [Paenibacillus sophorae]SEN32021.1 ABC-2 type transport system ATP-binding protein [Paenibacillus sophorae]
MSNVVEIREVSKSFEQFALDQVRFEVKKGFITGLIGPNGAGKSTLIKIMMDMVRPSGGEVRIFGSTLAENPGLKDRIGYVSDENYFYESMTIRNMGKMLAPFYKHWDNAAFTRYLEMFELSEKSKIKNLSRGMKMKFSLAVALSHHAELLLMDEPTAGLDPVFRRELLDLLGEQILDENKSIVFSTHNTNDLDRIADYIIFMNRGKVVFSDSKDEVLERYVMVKGGSELLDKDVRKYFVGVREGAHGFEALAPDRREAVRAFQGNALLEAPTLEDIMYFTVKGGKARV